MRLSLALQAALVAALFAAGCSGGDGGGGGNGGDPPIADAGDDAAARIHQSYTLNGAQSVDPEGKDLGFAWSILAAPDGSAVTLTSGGAVATPSFTPDAEGTYLFGLVVDDGKNLSALDTVEITVQLRIAVFGDDGGELASELALNGAGMVDDHFEYADTYVIGAAGDVLVMLDYRARTPILVAYHAFDGTREQLAAGEIGTVVTGGDWVAWEEFRNGQHDLFARNLLTGVESQVTNTSQVEAAGDLAGDILVWSETRDPLYETDVFASDLTFGSEIQVSPPAPGVSEDTPRTDGTTIVYSTLGNDVYAYDIDGQLLLPIATSASNAELAFGVSGDYVVLAIDTGGGPVTVRHRISDSARVTFAGNAGIPEIDGDYVLFSEGSDLQAYRLSTGTTSVVSASWENTDLADGVVVWTDLNRNVFSKVLPSGAATQITADPAEEFAVAALSSGVAWNVRDEDDLLEAFYSADGGATADLASGEAALLRDRTAEYDVAIVAPGGSGGYATSTIDALSSAGVPILAFESSGDNVAALYEDQDAYNLASEYGECGPATVRLGIAHPALEGFSAGAFVALERDLPSAIYSANALDVFAGPGTPPSDWEVLASHGASPDTCTLGGETVIATFTNADGTAVLLDGVATDDVELWLPERRQLVLSELRYLASTRAP